MNRNVVDISRHRSLSPAEATHKIRTLARDTGNIFITWHGKTRRNSREFVDADIYEMLRTGYVNHPPKKGKQGDWIYQMDSRPFRGCRGAAAITAILEDDTLHVITVMWLDR